MGEIYIGEGIDSSEAMRGPCDSGFHVPLTSESTTLVTALSDLGMDTSNGADISQYLKIPYAGYRYYTTGDISQQGVAGGYWASDGYSDSNYRLGNCVLFTSSVLYANNNQYRTLGLPVRPFRDTPVIPDSGWTQLYAGTGNSGVFHNSTLGLISISSDGTNWITIADKNLGATTVYNNGDTLSESNCGGYFQRGNNYMFPFTGNITTTYGYVDATNYGPGNYYSDSTFIKSTLSTRDWCYPANNDLRGRTTGITKKGNVKEIYVGEGIKSYEAMRGPCPEGFHVPSKDEWVTLCGILTSTFNMTTGAVTMGSYLKVPMAGRRLNTTSKVGDAGSQGFYWSSTAYQTDRAYYVSFKSSTLSSAGNNYRSLGASIRPFKDTPVIPNSSWTTLYDGSSTATGAGVFYNSTDGLISVSGDGVIRYTISDKNLGATIVYNQGDTLSDNNCGAFYQRGNNYGFAHSGTVSSTYTQADATGYGPGNYYTGNSFIKRNSVSNYDWSSVQNDNLRGGTTGITKAGNVIEVYVGTTKIREKQ